MVDCLAYHFLSGNIGAFVGSYEHSGIMRILLGLTSCLNTVVLVLFFLQKSLFGKLVIVAWLWISLLLLVDQKVRIDSVSSIGQIIGVFAWVFYFLKSKRVRNTFVR